LRRDTGKELNTHIALKARISTTNLIPVKIRVARTSVFLLLTLLALSISLGYFSIVLSRDKKGDFSAGNVKEHIFVISREPHSIEHPLERGKVRDYLSRELESMGIEPSYYPYDSVKVRNRPGEYISICNVYAKAEPLDRTDCSFILLVAHMDSRFRNKVKGKYVYSFGAADDGYGLGVILESVRVAMLYRDRWKQGIKILFTDSEELNLDGMRMAIKYNPEIFDNVGLVINIEARGVKGPALLFETSPGNKNLIRLYKNARYPSAYSITASAYSKMPNFTDFTLLRDSLPGLNFSVIDNLNYYHTDKDCFSNISLSSLDHYGMQITPLIEEYLTSDQYASPSALKCSDNQIYFTLPLFGIISLSQGLFLGMNLGIFLLLALLTIILVKGSRISLIKALKTALITLLYTLFAALTGFLVSYLTAAATGQKFSPVWVVHVKYEYHIILTLLIIQLIGYYCLWRWFIRKRYGFTEAVTGNLLLVAFVSGIIYIFTGENFFLSVPLMVSTISFLIFFCTRCSLPNMFSSLITILLVVPFMYILVVALTIGSQALFSVLSILMFVLLMQDASAFFRKIGLSDLSSNFDS
jgi:hypothetical protein